MSNRHVARPRIDMEELKRLGKLCERDPRYELILAPDETTGGYREVTLEDIYQEVEEQRYSPFSFDYYIGSSLAARWRYSARPPEYGGNMFPTKMIMPIILSL